MNILLLKYALEVERAGSISKAAKALYMNQPNLSKEVKPHLGRRHFLLPFPFHYTE